MMRKLIVIYLILFSSLVSFGQLNDSNISKEWHLEIGYQNFRTLDKNVTPLIYNSNNGVLGFKFQKKKPNKLWDIRASLSIGSNQSKRFGNREAVVYNHYSINGVRDSSVYNINPKVSFIQGSITYSYYWQLSNKRKEMHLGGQLHDNFIYGALGADVWFFNQLSIMPSIQMCLFGNSKSEIEAEISTPVLSYLVRQPYTLDPSLPENSYLKAYLRTGSSITSLNNFQQINIKLNYHYSLNNGNKIGLSYDFVWMNYANIPKRNLKAYSNSLLISYTF